MNYPWWDKKRVERQVTDLAIQEFLQKGGKVQKPGRGRYYIYFLIDPRSHKVFYIGKGQKDRMFHHENLVRQGKVPNNNYDLRNVIKEILDQGQEIIYKQVWFSNNEDKIYKKEKEFIKKHKEYLTNIAPGGRCTKEKKPRKKKRAKKVLPKSEYKKLIYKKL